MQDSKKIFCSPEKNQSQETFYNSIPDALHNLHTSNAKYLPIDLMMLAYENRQNATKFARANNSDLLRPLKLFISTRVHFIYAIANILLHIHLLQSTLHCTSITINPSLHIYYSQPFTTHLLQSTLHYTSTTVDPLLHIYYSQSFTTHILQFSTTYLLQSTFYYTSITIFYYTAITVNPLLRIY